MNFISYIQRQKQLVRNRHLGEEFLLCGAQSVPVRTSDEILLEIERMKGLNKMERANCEFYKIRRGEIVIKRARA